MVVDSSAILAILQRESEAAAFRHAIDRAPTALIGAATLFECSMVLLSRRGEGGVDDLTGIIEGGAIQIVPVDEHHAALALDAFRRYGRGRHRAGLNYGDCLSYALAKATGLPLLFKGDDFIHTDDRSAV